MLQGNWPFRLRKFEDVLLIAPKFISEPREGVCVECLKKLVSVNKQRTGQSLTENSYPVFHAFQSQNTG